MTNREQADTVSTAARGDRAGRSVNIYVDGFNPYYGCLKGSPYQWLDIGALCRKLVPSNPVEVLRTQEKGSDVKLASFLLLDAVKKESDIAVVVSNDSDLEEPIRALIQDLHVPVGLVNPHPAKYRSHDLLKLERATGVAFARPDVYGQPRHLPGLPRHRVPDVG
jgi:uncharacterized LabA/DUF88 family protein